MYCNIVTVSTIIYTDTLMFKKIYINYCKTFSHTQNNESIANAKYVNWLDSQTIPRETFDMTTLEEVRYYTKM